MQTIEKNHQEGLIRRTTGGGVVEQAGDKTWRLRLPAGVAGIYRLAQIEDPGSTDGKRLWRQPPQRTEVRARFTGNTPAGTWGFGFWNDPIRISLGLKGGKWQMPSLPQACWFFHASLPNHLALEDDQPGNGFLAGVFRSRRVSPVLAFLGGLAAPAAFTRAGARILRPILRRWVRSSQQPVGVDFSEWHSYVLEWGAEGVRFEVDGREIGKTPFSPAAPLQWLAWIDNQYASFPPGGALRTGTLMNSEASSLEIEFISTGAGDEKEF